MFLPSLVNVMMESFILQFDAACSSFPANTRGNKHVIITSKRRFGVTITCLIRCVFAGILSYCTPISFVIVLSKILAKFIEIHCGIKTKCSSTTKSPNSCWCLSHWPLRDVAVILKRKFWNSLYWIIARALTVKLLLNECHRTLRMRSQHWFI